jgi:hypothetical protein
MAAALEFIEIFVAAVLRREINGKCEEQLQK